MIPPAIRSIFKDTFFRLVFSAMLSLLAIVLTAATGSMWPMLLFIPAVGVAALGLLK